MCRVCCTVGYVCYDTLNIKQPNRSSCHLRCRLWLTKEPFAGWGPGLSQERGAVLGVFVPLKSMGTFCSKEISTATAIDKDLHYMAVAAMLLASSFH